MIHFNRFLRSASIALAVIGLGFFVYDALLFSRMQPRMVSFDTLTAAEENLFLWTGAGLLLLLAFTASALLHIARTLHSAEQVRVGDIVVILGLVLALLFVFSNVALLQDIMKQYRAGLAQPEWLLVWILMAFQVLATIGYLGYVWFAPLEKSHQQQVALDSNIYLIAQYIGLICGLLGLAFASLGYLFPRGWNLDVHTTFTMTLLLLPYGLVVGYWLLTKLQEKKILYDEKQLQDIGKSSFGTLLASMVIMVSLFILNYRDLGGITSMLWLPVLLFSVLFLFSLGNLYFSRKE